MKIYLNKLVLRLKQSEEVIEFSDTSYFYGKMGAGKTSIARLIDYCFGGDFEYSPALQQEFVSVNLFLSVNDNKLTLLRPRDASSVIASYSIDKENYKLVVPIDAGEEVIPNSGIENLSDFLFYMSGMIPPKVRRSKIKENSDLQRLSIRNLLWYCYLDQDEIDSDFFHLGSSANNWKRLASRDVLRFIIGFHQEKVSELEEVLTDLRDKRRSLNTAASTLRDVLNESSINSYEDIHNEIESLKLKETELVDVVKGLKSKIKKTENKHAVDNLKNDARAIFYEIESLDLAIRDVKELIARDSRHLNEIQMLKLKVKRDSSARLALLSVSYASCPSCFRSLPERPSGTCVVCGQEDCCEGDPGDNSEILDKDADSRIKELSAAVKDHKEQVSKLERKKNEYVRRKSDIDERLTKLLSEYDSVYLSTVLDTETKLISIKEKIDGLRKLQELPTKVNLLQSEASALTPEIKERNEELKKVREQAEKDTKNLDKLEHIFLEMLLRSNFPGIKQDDLVSIKSPDFLPDVLDSRIGDLAVTSFANLSSGGKKTIYKSCFALAVHCLAKSTKNTVLPSLLIIDSPMKNISERENREVFEGFINLIYELAAEELDGTQIIVIDKEYFPPPEEYVKSHKSRHMQPDSKEFPPLIPYYKGH
ncbi:AAA family ATPase [Marinomonas ostreistagni]|uniref:Rad50/SbcC-type AAA domain-containing protein n=1 Tax=Marinomonas ostreistagni TaxID=359209 RepID=A0ABS0Z782_9GAMM|nr:AAA family ATPase [Marinomonas ostreistagni]MBJ7549521.1 hypothetical protein [Marinomonas ostreistagni]